MEETGGDEQYWACAECARKCSKVHGRGYPPSRLSFFKVMLGQFKNSLIVPRKFARLLGNLVGQNIYLGNSNEQCWEVKLVKTDDCLVFQQGWHEFVSYHSIQVGEFLVFKYISTSSFVVQIFGTSGCERSHFCESIDSDVHKRCPTDCLCFRKDGRKNDTCRAHCCIGVEVPSGKKRLVRTTPCEAFLSPHLHCKTDGDFDKRKRPDTDYLCPHEDGGKYDKSAVHCHTKDKDSTRKKKAIETTCEILSAPQSAAKDMGGICNIQPMSSSHNMNNSSGFHTATAVEYSEVPCFAVSEVADKGSQESQMAPTDMHDNFNATLVSKNADEEQEVGQMGPSDAYANVNMSQVDLPELPCEFTKIDSWKEQETIVALPSEFIPSKVGAGNADKLISIEEKSFLCTDYKMSHTSCGKKPKRNKNELPSAESIPNIVHSPTKIGISPTNCLEVPPIISETNSSKELVCEKLVIELPISELSNERVASEEDKSSAAKDNVLVKASTAIISVSSQTMPSFKCSGDVVEDVSAYDLAMHRFLVDEEGACHIVQNSVSDPKSNDTSINLCNNDKVDAKCEASFTPTAKEISCHDTLSNDLCLAPIVGCGNQEIATETALIANPNNVHHASNGHLDTMGNNAAVIPEENDGLSVGDASQHMMPKSQEGSNAISGSSHEHGVKQDAVSQKSMERFEPYIKESVFKAVKTEIMEPDDLPTPTPNSTYFSFSLAVNTLSWHELLEPLRANFGKRRLERKVILLRDPVMRVWPVLYHESFRFTGFLGGWEAFVTANNIRKGDICHFETASHMEYSMLQVLISRAPDG